MIFKRLGLLIGLKSGVNLHIGSAAEWMLINDIIIRGEYDTAIDCALNKINDPEVNVLDCGANAGIFTVKFVDSFLLKHHDKKLNMILVEGSRRIIGALTERAAMTRRPGISIDIIHGLAGKKTGSAIMQMGRSDILNYVSAKPLKDWHSIGASKPVDYVDLETLTSKWDVIHFLKIDIEGSEFDLISSYERLFTKTKVLAIEFHSSFGDVEAAIYRLESFGLKAHRQINSNKYVPLLFFERA